ncbi:MAG TPA: hypothetical protein VFI47_27445 [Acidimicrobiales bacterium]|nr:hypothetical protein [Acidimicrobiales bacterium]
MPGRAAPRVLDPLEYPFDVPRAGYVWQAGAGGRASNLAPDVAAARAAARAAAPPAPAAGRPAGRGGEPAGRTAVLAIGSNASPTQLDRKFAAAAFADPATPEGRIPVVPATVPDVDVVYAARVAHYGAVPATLAPSPGTVAQVFVTWLTPAQLDRMNETESLGRAYRLTPVPGVRIDGCDPATVPAYTAIAGVARFGGGPLAVARVPATGRSFPAATQRAVWDRLAAAGGEPGGVPALLAAVVADPDRRAAVAALLRSGRLP